MKIAPGVVNFCVHSELLAPRLGRGGFPYDIIAAVVATCIL